MQRKISLRKASFSVLAAMLTLGGCALTDVSVTMTAPDSIEVFVPEFHSNPARAEELARQHCLKNGKPRFSISNSRAAQNALESGTSYLFQCSAG